MAVVFSDTFSTRTLAAVWNSVQGVTATGSAASIAAGGNYLGATGISQAAYREVVFQVVSGDRPGVKLYWDGGEVVSMTAVPASGSIDVSHFGASVGPWTYVGTNTWWRWRWNGFGFVFATSADGVSWTTAGSVNANGVALVDNEAPAVNGIFINSAGNGIGTGTSRSPTVIDNFTWQDWTPPAWSISTGTLDDAQRADENPLSNGGMWDSPGLVDGHTALALTGRRIVGTSDIASALTRASYGPGTEAWATLAANAPATAEPTVFLAMSADPKNGYVFWTDTVSNYYVGRFDAGTFTGLQPVLPTPGGAMLPGDRLALAAVNGVISAALSRSGGPWQLLTQLADATYPTGRLGLGSVRGVSYSAFGGGTIAAAARPRRSLLLGVG